MSKADLHIHSYYSDGVFSPREIVQKAKAAGLEVIAITDHDSVGGLAEAEKAAAKEAIDLLPALEFSCSHKKQDVHIIGYLIDCQSPYLEEHLRRFQEVRMKRLEEMVGKLKAVGIDIDLTKIKNQSEASSVGRPHIARALVEKGHAVDIKDAFLRYLRKGAAAFVPKTKVSPINIIQIIHQVGGVSVWAHPPEDNFSQMLKLLVDNGLDGIEVYFPDCTAEGRQSLMNAAEKYNIMITGGSDWHGSEPDLSLGDFYVDTEKIAPLMDLYNKSFPRIKGEKAKF